MYKCIIYFQQHLIIYSYKLNSLIYHRPLILFLSILRYTSGVDFASLQTKMCYGVCPDLKTVLSERVDPPIRQSHFKRFNDYRKKQHLPSKLILEMIDHLILLRATLMDVLMTRCNDQYILRLLYIVRILSRYQNY